MNRIAVLVLLIVGVAASSLSAQQLRTWRQLGSRERDGDPNPVCCVAFSNDGASLASASIEEVRLWNMVTGKTTTTWPGRAVA
jgi:WD40 repeat protein